MENPWTYDGKPVTDDVLAGFDAFVYMITNTVTGRRYIGKKITTRRVAKKPLKGKKRKRRSTVKSDWETYYGSSKALLADIELLGREAFRREILVLCRTRGESSYHEARLIMMNDALLSDDWYNESIMLRVHSSHLRKK